MSVGGTCTDRLYSRCNSRTTDRQAQDMFDRDKAPPLPKNQLGFLQFAGASALGGLLVDPD